MSVIITDLFRYPAFWQRIDKKFNDLLNINSNKELEQFFTDNRSLFAEFGLDKFTPVEDFAQFLIDSRVGFVSHHLDDDQLGDGTALPQIIENDELSKKIPSQLLEIIQVRSVIKSLIDSNNADELVEKYVKLPALRISSQLQADELLNGDKELTNEQIVLFQNFILDQKNTVNIEEFINHKLQSTTSIFNENELKEIKKLLTQIVLGLPLIMKQQIQDNPSLLGAFLTNSDPLSAIGAGAVDSYTQFLADDIVNKTSKQAGYNQQTYLLSKILNPLIADKLKDFVREHPLSREDINQLNNFLFRFNLDEEECVPLNVIKNPALRNQIENLLDGSDKNKDIESLVRFNAPLLQNVYQDAIYQHYKDNPEKRPKLGSRAENVFYRLIIEKNENPALGSAEIQKAFESLKSSKKVENEDDILEAEGIDEKISYNDWEANDAIKAIIGEKDFERIQELHDNQMSIKDALSASNVTQDDLSELNDSFKVINQQTKLIAPQLKISCGKDFKAMLQTCFTWANGDNAQELLDYYKNIEQLCDYNIEELTKLQRSVNKEFDKLPTGIELLEARNTRIAHELDLWQDSHKNPTQQEIKIKQQEIKKSFDDEHKVIIDQKTELKSLSKNIKDSKAFYVETMKRLRGDLRPIDDKGNSIEPNSLARQGLINRVKQLSSLRILQYSSIPMQYQDFSSIVQCNDFVAKAGNNPGSQVNNVNNGVEISTEFKEDSKLTHMEVCPAAGKVRLYTKSYDGVIGRSALIVNPSHGEQTSKDVHFKLARQTVTEKSVKRDITLRAVTMPPRNEGIPTKARIEYCMEQALYMVNNSKPPFYVRGGSAEDKNDIKNALIMVGKKAGFDRSSIIVEHETSSLLGGLKRTFTKTDPSLKAFEKSETVKELLQNYSKFSKDRTIVNSGLKDRLHQFKQLTVKVEDNSVSNSSIPGRN